MDNGKSANLEKENSGKNFKPRDYDFEQELNVDKSNIMCNS